jgi:hypothetical protein
MEKGLLEKESKLKYLTLENNNKAVGFKFILLLFSLFVQDANC